MANESGDWNAKSWEERSLMRSPLSTTIGHWHRQLRDHTGRLYTTVLVLTSWTAAKVKSKTASFNFRRVLVRDVGTYQ